MVPYSPSLLLTINVLQELEHVVLGVASFGLNPLRKFHVDVRLNGSLGVSHNEVNLTKSPAEDDAHNYHKPDCEPGNDRRIGLEIIHPKNLFSTM